MIKEILDIVLGVFFMIMNYLNEKWESILHICFALTATMLGTIDPWLMPFSIFLFCGAYIVLK